MSSTKKGSVIFIGRFQPFHKGHLHVVKRLSKRYRRVIITIGSSQHSHTGDNPFSSAERKRMIISVLKDAAIKNYVIIVVPDIGVHAKWVRSIESKAPRFQAVYSGNAFVCSLFRKDGYPAHVITLVGGFTATKIRTLMKKKGNWQALVPAPIAMYITKHKLDQRVRRLS